MDRFPPQSWYHRPGTPAPFGAFSARVVSPDAAKRQEEATRTAARKAAAEAAAAARKADDETFTIPGQDDARTAFQKVQGRPPDKKERFTLRKIVAGIKDAMNAQSEAGFIRQFLGLQFYIANLKEAHGDDNARLNRQVGDILRENERLKTFVIDIGHPTPEEDNRGWHSGNFDTLGYFKKVQKRDPTPEEEKRLHRYVEMAKNARAHDAGDGSGEKAFDLAIQRARFYGHFLRDPDHNEYGKMLRSADDVVRRHTLEYYANKPHGVLGEIADWGHSLTKGMNSFLSLPGVNLLADATGSIIHGAEKLYKGATDVLDKIPVLGSVVHSGLNLAGGELLNMADAAARGDNISQTALHGMKESLADASNLAQYTSIVTSFVPGIAQVGSGITGALAAANALASGRNITDALIQAAEDAALASIPGGAVGDVVQKVAKEAFEAGRALARGDSLDKALADRIRSKLPAEAQKVFDVGFAVAHGQKLQNAIIDGVKSLGTEELGKLASDGASLVTIPGPIADAAKSVSGKAREGFDIANGILARTGVPPAALAALRNKLDAEAKAGFDKAVGVHADAAALGKKLQTAVVEKVASLPGSALDKLATKGDAHVKESADLQALAAALKTKKARDGFKLALGVLSHGSVPPKALAAFSSRLNKEAKHGFDRGVHAAAQRTHVVLRLTNAEGHLKAALDSAVV